MKLAGPAFTVKGAVTAERNEADRESAMMMIRSMTHPCIEVRDRGTPFNVAIYGELSAATAKAHGAVGALLDGGTRDCGHLISRGFPVFARFRSPVEAFGRYMILKCQVPIRISGELAETVELNPGDFIFGDEDGVLVIPKDLTLQVLYECERIKSDEDKARIDFGRGDDPVDVFQRYRRL
jgi:regulator of RNase E activity RraA